MKTRLAVCLDTNVFVRLGWLAPLIQCQVETGRPWWFLSHSEAGERIHAAGNDLFITHENGQAFGSMELRFNDQQVCETTNLKRRDVDFGEVHCQLFEVATTLRVGAYAEPLRERTDIESGLVLTRAGCSMMFEPRSTVFLYYPELITDLQDVALHRWKWDMPAILASFQRIRDKWNIDVNGPRGHFQRYLVAVNGRVGPFTQLRPGPASIFLDRLLHRLPSPIRLMRWYFRAWRSGYYARSRRGPGAG